MDKIYLFMKSRNGGVGRPEFRLREYRRLVLFFGHINNTFRCSVVNIVPGTVLLPIGLLLSGWTAQNHVFWLVPDVVSDMKRFLSVDVK